MKLSIPASLPLEFDVQLVGTLKHPFDRSLLEVPEKQVRVPAVDVHGVKCIHPTCQHPAATTRPHGWLCGFHQGQLEADMARMKQQLESLL